MGPKERVMHQVEDHVEVTPQEARAGQTRTHLLTILVVSTLAAAIIMGAFWTLTALN
jgi:predicted secreted protein